MSTRVLFASPTAKPAAAPSSCSRTRSASSRAVRNREKSLPLLARSDGGAWKASHQVRPMKRALMRAGLDGGATFYALRHSYISRAIEGGVPLNVVAENCGTSVRMIETTYAKVIAAKRRDFISKGAPTLNAAWL